MKKVVTLEEACREAIVSLLLEEVSQQLLGHLSVLRLGRVLHGVTEQVVLFAQLHALLPTVVALVEVGGDATELYEFVFLHLLCQRDVVEVVEGVDGGLQSVVIFLGDQ